MEGTSSEEGARRGSGSKREGSRNVSSNFGGGARVTKLPGAFWPRAAASRNLPSVLTIFQAKKAGKFYGHDLKGGGGRRKELRKGPKKNLGRAPKNPFWRFPAGLTYLQGGSDLKVHQEQKRNPRTVGQLGGWQSRRRFAG